jgi:hypothetical protein
MNIARLEQVVADMQANLRGLIATDIWERDSRRSLASLASQPAAVALFGDLTANLKDALGGAGFPGLNRFFILDLEADNTVMVIQHGTDILQGLLLNTKLTNMGTMLSIGLRTAQQGVEEARRLPDTRPEVLPEA